MLGESATSPLVLCAGLSPDRILEIALVLFERLLRMFEHFVCGGYILLKLSLL